MNTLQLADSVVNVIRTRVKVAGDLERSFEQLLADVQADVPNLAKKTSSRQEWPGGRAGTLAKALAAARAAQPLKNKNP